MVTMTVRERADICGNAIEKVAYVRLSHDRFIMWYPKPNAKKFLFVHVTGSNLIYWAMRERTFNIRIFKKFRFVKAA